MSNLAISIAPPHLKPHPGNNIFGVDPKKNMGQSATSAGPGQDYSNQSGDPYFYTKLLLFISAMVLTLGLCLALEFFIPGVGLITRNLASAAFEAVLAGILGAALKDLIVARFDLQKEKEEQKKLLSTRGKWLLLGAAVLLGGSFVGMYTDIPGLEMLSTGYVSTCIAVTAFTGGMMIPKLDQWSEKNKPLNRFFNYLLCPILYVSTILLAVFVAPMIPADSVGSMLMDTLLSYTLIACSAAFTFPLSTVVMGKFVGAKPEESTVKPSFLKRFWSTILTGVFLIAFLVSAFLTGGDVSKTMANFFSFVLAGPTCFLTYFFCHILARKAKKEESFAKVAAWAVLKALILVGIWTGLVVVATLFPGKFNCIASTAVVVMISGGVCGLADYFVGRLMNAPVNPADKSAESDPTVKELTPREKTMKKVIGTGMMFFILIGLITGIALSHGILLAVLVPCASSNIRNLLATFFTEWTFALSWRKKGPQVIAENAPLPSIAIVPPVEELVTVPAVQVHPDAPDPVDPIADEEGDVFADALERLEVMVPEVVGDPLIQGDQADAEGGAPEVVGDPLIQGDRAAEPPRVPQVLDSRSSSVSSLEHEEHKTEENIESSIQKNPLMPKTADQGAIYQKAIKALSRVASVLTGGLFKPSDPDPLVNDERLPLTESPR